MGRGTFKIWPLIPIWNFERGLLTQGDVQSSDTRCLESRRTTLLFTFQLIRSALEQPCASNRPREISSSACH